MVRPRLVILTNVAWQMTSVAVHRTALQTQIHLRRQIHLRHQIQTKTGNIIMDMDTDHWYRTSLIKDSAVQREGKPRLRDSRGSALIRQKDARRNVLVEQKDVLGKGNILSLTRFSSNLSKF